MSLGWVTYESHCHGCGDFMARGFDVGVPGLAVQAAHECGPSEGWHITHVRSGAVVVWGLKDPETAAACAYELGRLCDWTDATDALRMRFTDLEPALFGIVERFGAEDCTGDSTDVRDRNVVA